MRHLSLEAGEYRFTLNSDDGVRLWVDGEVVIDRWTAGRGIHTGSVLFDTPGDHIVQLEYFEADGDARVHLSWRV